MTRLSTLTLFLLIAAASTRAAAAPDDLDAWLSRASEEAAKIQRGWSPFPPPLGQVECYIEIARLQVVAGEKDAAMKTLEIAARIHGGAHKGNEAEALAYPLASAYAQAGDPKRAQTIIVGLPPTAADPGRDQLYEQVAAAYAKTGDFTAAKSVAQSISNFALSNREGAFHEIAIAQAKAGDLAAAKATLAEVKLADDSTLAQVRLEAGDVADAERTAAAITSPYQRAAALSEAANYLLEHRQRDEALHLLDAVRDIAVQSAPPREVPTPLPELLAEQAVLRQRLGQADESRKTLGLARDILNKQPPDPLVPLRRNSTMIAIALATAEAGDPASALNLLRNVKLPAAPADAPKELRLAVHEGQDALTAATAQVQTWAGDLPSARATLAKLGGGAEFDYGMAAIYRRIAAIAAYTGKFAEIKTWSNSLTRPEQRLALALGAAEGILTQRDQQRKLGR
jgi:hypothetical protein